MEATLDIVGKTFGRLTAIKELKERASSGNILCLCRCSCGNLSTVSKSDLSRSHIRSCGCLRSDVVKALRTKDITNQRFNRLTAISPGPKSQTGILRWNCKCDCGNVTLVATAKLINGSTKSCGCLNNERIRTKRNPLLTEYKKEFSVFSNILSRCNNPAAIGYKNYGGRGITCELSFNEFVSEVGKRPSQTHTIERIDNDLGYVKGNLRWATRIEQARNKRNTVLIEHRGEKKTLAEWGAVVGISEKTLRSRILDMGWSAEKALLTKPRLTRKAKSTAT